MEVLLRFYSFTKESDLCNTPKWNAYMPHLNSILQYGIPFFSNIMSWFQNIVSGTPDFTWTTPAQNIISSPFFLKRTSILHRWHSSYQTSNDVCLDTSQTVCKIVRISRQASEQKENFPFPFKPLMNICLSLFSLTFLSTYSHSTWYIYISAISKTITKFLFWLLHPMLPIKNLLQSYILQVI